MFDFSSSPVTLFLLLINVLVSGYALFMDPKLLDRLSFRVDRILEQREYYRMVSGGFVHAGLGHLLFNMITLYFFGPILEQQIFGPLKFAILYFGSMMVAHGLALYLHRRNPSYAAVGASGAISGVVFAFCMFAPFELLYVFFALPIPAILFAVGYVAASIYAMRQQPATRGGIAHEAHLGGALGGIVLTVLLEPKSVAIFLSQLGL